MSASEASKESFVAYAALWTCFTLLSDFLVSWKQFCDDNHLEIELRNQIFNAVVYMSNRKIKECQFLTQNSIIAYVT